MLITLSNCRNSQDFQNLKSLRIFKNFKVSNQMFEMIWIFHKKKYKLKSTRNVSDLITTYDASLSFLFLSRNEKLLIRIPT